jgi:AbiV family abortive infection protein
MGETFALVAAPDHWTATDLTLAEAIVRNAVRLLDDAALLQTYERWGTAHTLSTIAFEEAGKVVLHCWNNDEKVKQIGKSWSFHIKKQTASACLLLADSAKTLLDTHPERRGLATFEKGPSENHSTLRDDLAEFIRSSKANRLLELVALNAVEKSKNAGLYVDDWTIDQGFEVGVFSKAQSEESVSEAKMAIRLLRSKDHLRIAKVIFQTDPLRADYLAAGRKALRKR